MPLKGYIVLLDEFLYKIGFDVDSGKIKQIEQGLKNISSLAKQTAQPISDAVKAGMERNAELIAKLEQAKNQGVEWCEEAKEQAEELTTSFHEVAEAEEKVGEKAKEASKETKKLTEKKPATNLEQELSNIRGKFMLIGAAATAASGLIANYLTVPLQNIDELAKKKDRLFNITQAEIIQAKEYQDQLQKTKTAVQSIVTQTAIKLIPVVNQSLKGFNNFLKANKALVVEGLTNVFKWILKLGQVFTNTFRFLNKVISSTIGWKAALLILVGVLAVVKRAMLAAFLTNPIGWVIMLIGGLILLIDDLMTYLDGGESLLGDYWKPFIEWGKKAIAWFKSVKPTIEQVLNNIMAIFSGIFNISPTDINSFVLNSYVSAFSFLLIVHALMFAFGRVGQFTSIVFMILQLASSGGMFPIVTTPQIFQNMAPFMPLYYSLTAFRQAILGGLSQPIFKSSIFSLIIFGLIFGVISLLAYYVKMSSNENKTLSSNKI